MPQEPIKVIVAPPPMNAAGTAWLALAAAVTIIAAALYVISVRRSKNRRKDRRDNLWN